MYERLKIGEKISKKEEAADFKRAKNQFSETLEVFGIFLKSKIQMNI